MSGVGCTNKYEMLCEDFALHDEHLLDDGLQKGLVCFGADDGFTVFSQLGESLQTRKQCQMFTLTVKRGKQV